MELQLESGMLDERGLAENARLLLGGIKESPSYKVVRGGSVEFASKDVDVLRRLRSQQGADAKAFAAALRPHVTHTNTAVVAYLFLVDLRDLDGIGWLLKKKSPGVVETTLTTMLQVLHHEPHRFSGKELRQLRSILPDPTAWNVTPSVAAVRCNQHVRSIYARLDSIERLLLTKQLLEGVNPEINADRQTVRERAAKLGLSPDIDRALAEIDSRILAAADPFDYKGCVDLARSVLERFVKESAKKVEPKAKKPLSTGPGTNHFGTPLDYLKNAGLISEDEHRSLNDFYKLLSNESAHKLGSSLELARVSKNMLIEWMLLLTGRVTQGLE